MFIECSSTESDLVVKFIRALKSMWLLLFERKLNSLVSSNYSIWLIINSGINPLKIIIKFK